MGNYASQGQLTQKRIQHQMRTGNQAREVTLQLLLLGAGESGKSTVMKQVRISQGRELNSTESFEMKSKILLSLFSNMVNVLREVQIRELEFTPELSNAAEHVQKSYDEKRKQAESYNVIISPEDVHNLTLLFESKIVKELVKTSHTFQMEDTWPEFMSRLENYPEWGGKKWEPDQEEILLARVRTTGVITETFPIRDVKFQVIDVGGQRSERRKWYKLFRDVSGVIFVAAMSAYNQSLFEDPNVNRLTEAVDLWEDTTGRPEFEDAVFILFLNKEDLFRKKYYYDKMPLVKPVDDCDEPPKVEDETSEECHLAKEWYQKLFRTHDRHNSQGLFLHFTTALDTTLMPKIIQNTSHHVMAQTLHSAGIMRT